jgi:hypothetical protein
MGSYFNGWKRKAGIVVLILACIFMAGWFRSFRGTDYLYYYPSSIVKQECMSNRGSLRWERSEDARHIVPQDQQWRLRWSYIPFAPPKDTDFFIGEVTVRYGDEKPSETIWQCCGIEVGEYQLKTTSGTVRRNYWQVAYLWCVLPLTLLSAWQLLSRPKQLRPRK